MGKNRDSEAYYETSRVFKNIPRIADPAKDSPFDSIALQRNGHAASREGVHLAAMGSLANGSINGR